MFENFTFGAMAQTSDSEKVETSTSPTDCSFPSIMPEKFSVLNPGAGGALNDIESAFAQQTLRQTTPPCEEDLCRPNANRVIWDTMLVSTPDFRVRDHSGRPSTMCSMVGPARNGALACRRLKRQADMRLQCSSSHIRDISALVQNMIATSSQCILHDSPPSKIHGLSLSDPLNLDEGDGGSCSDNDDDGFSDTISDRKAEVEEIWERSLEVRWSLRRARIPRGVRKVRYGSGDGVTTLQWRQSVKNVADPRRVRNQIRMRRHKIDSVGSGYGV